MTAAKPRHAVVVPCFNEADRLPRQAFLDHLAAHADVLLVFVDDGSTDGTGAVLAAMRHSVPDRIEVVTLDRNRGKGAAVRRGILHAAAKTPATFGYWDADLSTPLDQIGVFAGVLDAHPDVHVVLGSRIKLLGSDIRRRVVRHYVGRVLATLAAWAVGLEIYDTQCGAKLFRNTRGTRWLFRAAFRTRWLFDVEMLARLGRLGRRRAAYDARRCVHEQPVPVWHDVPGSKIHLLDGVKAVGQLLAIGLRRRCGR